MALAPDGLEQRADLPALGRGIREHLARVVQVVAVVAATRLTSPTQPKKSASSSRGSVSYGIANFTQLGASSPELTDITRDCGNARVRNRPTR